MNGKISCILFLLYIEGTNLSPILRHLYSSPHCQTIPHVHCYIQHTPDIAIGLPAKRMVHIHKRKAPLHCSDCIPQAFPLHPFLIHCRSSITEQVKCHTYHFQAATCLPALLQTFQSNAMNFFIKNIFKMKSRICIYSKAIV